MGNTAIYFRKWVIPIPSAIEPLFKFRHMFLRRLKNRLKPLFRFREIWNWECESCERCGSCFKLAYILKDEVWLALYGSDNGVLCLNCALEKALEKGIFVKPEDIEWLNLFYGDDGSYDVTGYEYKGVKE